MDTKKSKIRETFIYYKNYIIHYIRSIIYIPFVRLKGRLHLLHTWLAGNNKKNESLYFILIKWISDRLVDGILLMFILWQHKGPLAGLAYAIGVWLIISWIGQVSNQIKGKGN